MTCPKCSGHGRIKSFSHESGFVECKWCCGMGTVAEPEEDRIMEVKEGRVESVLKKS